MDNLFEENDKSKKTRKTKNTEKTGEENENQEQPTKENNAYLIFKNSIKIPVIATGKKGIFCGYISVINGIFSVEQIQKNSIEQQIFTTDNCDIQVGNIKSNKHIIFIGQNFVHNKKKTENLKNATFITGIKAYELAIKVKDNENPATINNEKCLIVFPEKPDDLTEEESNKIYNLLSSDCNFLYEQNLLENVKYFKPYFYKNNISPYKCIKRLPIHTKRKKVLVIDFGCADCHKEILNNYFNCTFCHYTETARSTFYLFKKKRIDGVIIPPSLGDASLINQEVKEEMKKIIESNIPVLGIEFGAVLTAELLGSTTENTSEEYCYNEHFIMNYKHKMLRASKLFYKNITSLPQSLNQTYFDKNNNIAGFYDYHHKNIGYNFSFCFDTADTAKLLNDFYKLLK